MAGEWKQGLACALGVVAPVGIDVGFKGKKITQLRNVKLASLVGWGAGAGGLIVAAAAPPGWRWTTEDKVAAGIFGGLALGIATLVHFLPAPARRYELELSEAEKARLRAMQRGGLPPARYVPEVYPEISVLVD